MKPIDNAILALADDLSQWRRALHAAPELGYQERETASYVAARLREFGVDEIEEGVAETGVVAVIHGADGAARGADERILLRSDMDALPIEEATGASYASRNPGRMHACGHDGHMAMLLGAAKTLADRRGFSGSVVLAFQPAEEGGAGAKAMIDEGLFERWPVRAVYGMHSLPGAPVGDIGVIAGPVLASADEFEIEVTGLGGHAAMPHLARDPLVMAAQIILALQSIVSRVVDPVEPAVVSVTTIAASQAHNVIAERATLGGTVRSFDQATHERIYEEIARQASRIAEAMGGAARVTRSPICYPSTVNDPDEAALAARVVRDVLGDDKLRADGRPEMGSEDFAYMAEARPGAFVFLGNGDSAPLHHPEYDFDDAAAAHGVAYWTRLAETALPRRR